MKDFLDFTTSAGESVKLTFHEKGYNVQEICDIIDCIDKENSIERQETEHEIE